MLWNRGQLFCPSVILDDDSNGGYSPLEYGRTYVYNSVKYTPAVIPAERIYEETEDKIFYTACIVGLDLEKYTRQYTARGYIRYLDLNGMQRLAYTKESSANPFARGKADIGIRVSVRFIESKAKRLGFRGHRVREKRVE